METPYHKNRTELSAIKTRLAENAARLKNSGKKLSSTEFFPGQLSNLTPDNPLPMETPQTDDLVKPQTYGEFLRFRGKLEAVPFKATSCSPIILGLQRSEFELQRLTRLVNAAEAIPGVTSQSRLPALKRALERTRQSMERFKILAEEQNQFMTTNVWSPNPGGHRSEKH